MAATGTATAPGDASPPGADTHVTSGRHTASSSTDTGVGGETPLRAVFGLAEFAWPEDPAASQVIVALGHLSQGVRDGLQGAELDTPAKWATLASFPDDQLHGFLNALHEGAGDLEFDCFKCLFVLLRCVDLYVHGRVI